jgi:predicted RNase H-like HicB family nuclease
LLPSDQNNTEMNQRKPPRSARSQNLQFNIETEREMDGRWIAEIPEIPGAMAYGRTEKQAKAKAYALALRAIADDVEKSKRVPQSISIGCISA